MATVPIQLHPFGAGVASSGAPELKFIAGSNTTEHVYAFDAAATETLLYKFIARSYGSGNLTLNVYWYADTASSGDVVWEGKIMALTPETDTQDVETDAWATANTVTDSHLGTTGQRLHTASVTISNLDSLAANDFVRLSVSRLGGNGSDTMTGDAIVEYCELTYSDT